MTEAGADDRPAWVDTLFLVAVAAAVVVAATSVLLVLTRPDDATVVVESAGGTGAVTTPSTTTPLSTTTLTTTSTTSTTMPLATTTTVVTPTTFPNIHPGQEDFNRAVRMVVSVDARSDSSVLLAGLEECRIIDDFMAGNTMSEWLATTLAAGTIRDVINEVPATRRERVAILWAATRFLCPEHHAVAQEAFPSGP